MEPGSSRLLPACSIQQLCWGVRHCPKANELRNLVKEQVATQLWTVLHGKVLILTHTLGSCCGNVPAETLGIQPLLHEP